MTALKNLANRLLRIVRRLRTRHLVREGDANKIFTTYYRYNKWRGRESVSGEGSDPENTAVVEDRLPAILAELGARSMLDIPCGDFAWMQRVDLADVRYLGGDIVEPLIEENRTRYESQHIHFQRLDIVNDPLPKVDLLLCRDCLVHFSFDDIFNALRNISAVGSGYLFTTTFPAVEQNYDIRTGGWRPLNLELSPFDFPPPLMMIHEGYDDPEFADKSLALWRVSDVPPVDGSKPAIT